MLLQGFLLLLYVLCLMISTVFSEGGRWTVWYNVQRADDYGDNESWSNIRKHRYTVCGNEMPKQARCRIKGESKVFTSENLIDVPNTLYEPCTEYGLICRNKDQSPLWQGRCRDYEVSFYCLYSGKEYDDTNSSNYGIVAMAAGLCVIAPLLFVALLQCIRQQREKRQQRIVQRREITQTENVESSTEDQSETMAPPTYDSLFTLASSVGTSGSMESLIHTESSNYHGQQTLQQSSNNTEQNTEHSANSSNSGQDNPIFHISSGAYTVPSNLWNQRRHFPGMHISIGDLIVPRYDDIITPPPTYDAVRDGKLIKGDIPPKYNDIV